MRATDLTTRRLPVDEWPKLTGTLLESVWPSLHPTEDIVLVVESGDSIVGCVAFYAKWHVDGVWIRPEDRGRVSVGRALQRLFETTASELHAREVWMMSLDAESSRLCARVGASVTPLLCEHFAVKTGVS